MIVNIIDKQTQKVIDRGLYFNRTLHHVQIGDSIEYNECFAWRKYDIRTYDYKYEGERKEKWSNDLYMDTLSYVAKVLKASSSQVEKKSSIRHLTCVAQEVMALDCDNFSFDDAIQIALMHDLLKNRALAYEELCSEVGERIADAVAVLSINKDIGIELQWQDLMERIEKSPVEVAIVKMADLVTNLHKPPREWSEEKKIAYADEAEKIMNRLESKNGQIAERLERKIFEYRLWHIGGKR